MKNEEDFIRFLEIKRGLKPASIYLCRFRLKTFFEWLRVKDNELTKENIEEFFADLKRKGRSNNSLNTFLFALHQLEDYYIDRGKKADFLRGFKTFSIVRSVINVLTPQEIQDLIDARIERGDDIYFRNATMLMFLSQTGARLNEMLSLQVRYLDTSNGKINFVDTKNKESRNVYIVDPLLARMKQLVNGKKPEDLVFSTIFGNKISSSDFSKDIKDKAKLANISANKNIHPHLFRHTYATQLYTATRDIGLVQIVLGHKNIKSTMVYIHIADEIVKEGMYRHPAIRVNIDPRKLIEYVEGEIERYELDKNPLFDCVKAKEAIHQFTIKLYEAITNSSNEKLELFR